MVVEYIINISGSVKMKADCGELANTCVIKKYLKNYVVNDICSYHYNEDKPNLYYVDFKFQTKIECEPYELLMMANQLKHPDFVYFSVDRVESKS